MKLANSALTAGNEEAYGYFTKILETDGNNSEAWFGKASSAGWLSTLAYYRIPEMLTSLDNAIKCSTDENKEAMRVKSDNLVESVTIAYYTLARQHFLEYKETEDCWFEYLDRSIKAVDVLENNINMYEDLKSYDISNPMKWIVNICKENIDGLIFTEHISN